MTRIAGLLRPWSVRVFGNILGATFYVCSRRYRTVALRNLKAAYPEKTDDDIRTIAVEVFKHFARGALEFFYFLSLNQDQVASLIDLEGREHIDAALAEGRGCIIVTAHYGNWELLARKLVSLGYKVNVIARDSDDPGMTGITTMIREHGGYRVFDRDQPIIGAFRCLKNNEILGILPDQNEAEGVFANFFGRPVASPVGPAVLALRTGAPIVPVFAPRGYDGRYHAVVYPRLEFEPTGDDEKDTLLITDLINQAIEREVRRYPSQWLWLHDRWKRTAEAQTVDR
jgi:KDO2-lipid IV(A) lauroyltransferase